MHTELTDVNHCAVPYFKPPTCAGTTILYICVTAYPKPNYIPRGYHVTVAE